MGGWVVGASFHLGNEFSIDFSVGVGGGWRRQVVPPFLSV